jgi:hypothetical protein
VTVLAERTTTAPAVPHARRSRRPLLLAAALAVAGLLTSLLLAAPGLTSFAETAPSVTGAPYVTVPEYGERGAYILGYEHGAKVELAVPVTNTGRLPVTIRTVALQAGAAPLLLVRGAENLPLTLGPGSSATVRLRAELTNCRYYHERALQVFSAVTVGYRSLWREGKRTVAFDRPIYLKGPMLVGCPGRMLDRNAENRSGLL